MDLTAYPVAPPKIVAIASAAYLHPTHPFPDPDLPGTPPKYSEDFTFGTGRDLPGGTSMGSTEADLKPYMQALVGVFASGDKSGMTQRLFDRFLAKQTSPVYFEDKDLNDAAAHHDNVKGFCREALGAPGWGSRPAGHPDCGGKRARG